MRFSIFYEQQLPKPWSDGDEVTLFSNALEQVELADRLGYDKVWVAEHHFLPEYSHSSAPELFLAAATQRTSRIRLGHGIIQATTNHPARIAERIATLDVLSNGRAELGLGEGQGMMELEPFGVTMEEKRARFEDTVRATLPMLYNDSWEYAGPYLNVPRRTVVPHPVQKPHPPLSVACTKVKTIRDAGAWGMGVLGFAFASPERARVWVSAYYNEYLLRPRRLTDYQPNPNIAVASYFMCAPNDEEAVRRNDGSTFFEFSLGQYSRKILTSTTDSLWERYQQWRQTEEGRAKSEKPIGLIGSPERLRRKVQQMADSHVDEIVLLVQTGKSKHEQMCESLELFAREVMPAFQDDPEHDAWKRDVLDGRIVLDDPSDDDLAVDGERMPGPPRAAVRSAVARSGSVDA
jgi:alkanesulfonate monooxygenase SsuD/methylene tetrahydromethanopterin reductase-like flavin-dependent oxidoreductase (luciferase family)